MTKEKWIEHMEQTEGLVLPSQGGRRWDWHLASLRHMEQGCKECAARLRTRRAGQARGAREAAYRAAGLVKVRGAVTGQTYWE